MPTASAIEAHQEFRTKFCRAMSVEPQEAHWWNGLRDSEQKILTKLIRGGGGYVGKPWQELGGEEQRRVLRARDHVRDMCTMPGER